MSLSQSRGLYTRPVLVVITIHTCRERVVGHRGDSVYVEWCSSVGVPVLVSEVCVWQLSEHCSG